MARAKSPEKEKAILAAAAAEIAESGVGAATARIAMRAGIAEGTLFTYFSSKDELLNTVYLELKTELIGRMLTEFPARASLERRARHMWASYIGWATEQPAKRKAVAQLSVSEVVTAETRAAVSAGRSELQQLLAELSERGALRGLPPEFTAALMMSMEETTMEFVAKSPRRKQQLIEAGFEAFWRAVK
ncbi:MAG: TetR/AcrR family transcriptional regulator [Acidobacteriota bacterium]